MTNKRYKSLLRQTWHPSEDELLFYLDGENDANSNARVEAHLKDCWACRVKRGKIDQLISDFVESRKASLGSSSNSRSEAWLKLQTRLDLLDSEMGMPPLFSRLLHSLRQSVAPSNVSLRWVMPLAASFCVLYFLIRLGLAPSVSAKEVLERSKRARAESIQQVTTPVLYQKLRVRRNSLAPRSEETVTWEIWNDTGNNRVQTRVGDLNGLRFVQPRGHSHTEGRPSLKSPLLPPVLAELDQIFENNNMDGQEPLSPAAYEAWRNSIQPKSEQIIEAKLGDGDKAVVLKTVVAGAFAVNAIVQAELLVRTEDWHPIQQRLTVRAERETKDYELTETAFQVLPLTTLTPSIFADLTPAPVSHATVTSQVAAPALKRSSSTTELWDAEIEVHYALHRAKACLGEPIEVVRENSSSRIEVRGLVNAAERKGELLNALQGMSLASVKIETLEEATKRTLAPPESPAGSDPLLRGQMVLVKSIRLPVEDQLEKYFRELNRSADPVTVANQPEQVNVQSKIRDFSNRAASFSSRALAEAWALRRLAELHSPGTVARLSKKATWLLEVMVHEHISVLKTQISDSRVWLEPVLKSLAGSTDTNLVMGKDLFDVADNAYASWNAASLTIFASMDTIDRLVHGLFSLPGLPSEKAEDVMRDLLSEFLETDSEFRSLEQAVAREFSGNPGLLTGKQ